MVMGTWPKDDIRRAFVAGAAWWEYHKAGATMWSRDRNDAETEAEKRYPDARPNQGLESTAPAGSTSTDAPTGEAH